MTDENTVIMERGNLLDIPRYTLPEGYAILTYQPGDEGHWYEIHLDAEHYAEVTEELFATEFGSDVDELSKRQFYLHHGKEVVGTASAWYDLNYKDGAYGRIHWVAIKSRHQGLGLSKPLMSRVCLTLASLGYDKACLSTSRLRPVAIHLYEQFGFTIV